MWIGFILHRVRTSDRVFVNMVMNFGFYKVLGFYAQLMKYGLNIKDVVP